VAPQLAGKPAREGEIPAAMARLAAGRRLRTVWVPRRRHVRHVDLGALGVGDRWGDLAIATWSAEWNYGPGWEDALLRAYGVAPDPLRTG
jgi:aminoglycoside phosphotransferase